MLDVGGRTDVTADVCHDVSSQADGPGSDSAGNGELGADPDPDPNRDPEIGNSDDGDSDDRDNEASVVPEIDDWELPASAFRPTGRWLAPVHPAQGQRVRRRAWAPSAGHPQRASHPAGAGEHRHCRVGSVAVRVHGHSGPTDGSLLPRRRRCGISQRSRARLHQPDLRGAVVAVRPGPRDPGTRGSNHCKQSRRKAALTTERKRTQSTGVGVPARIPVNGSRPWATGTKRTTILCLSSDFPTPDDHPGLTRVGHDRDAVQAFVVDGIVLGID